MRDQILDEAFDLRPANVHGHPALGAAGALVDLLVANEFRVGENRTMFEIVDAQSYRLMPGNRAQMAGQLHVMCVRLLDRRAQFIARDVHVRLVGGDALVSPVIDHALRIVRAGELVHLRKECRLAFQVGRGQIDLGSGHQAGIDPLLHLDIGVRLDAAGSAHGRHTCG